LQAADMLSFLGRKQIKKLQAGNSFHKQPEAASLPPGYTSGMLTSLTLEE